MQSAATNTPAEDEELAESVRAVEDLLKYKFVNKKLLEEALTHPSYTGSPSYERLEYVGDKALGLAFSNYIFVLYPDLDPGKLTLLHGANTSNEKLARIAVRHHLYNYLRHNIPSFDQKVREFVMAVEEEDETEIYGGLVKAPKVLADIVESLAAAVYFDCNSDLKAMWMIFRDFLEPMVMLDVLEKLPQPVTFLFQMCQKDGKRVSVEYCRKEEKTVASIYVDEKFVTSASSEQKENAKLHAAKAALIELSYASGDLMNVDIFDQLNGDSEIEAAKQKLHEILDKKKWPKPNYKIQEEFGPAHEKRYVCSVEIETTKDVQFVKGKEKPRRKEAENSAAYLMLLSLKDSGYI